MVDGLPAVPDVAHAWKSEGEQGVTGTKPQGAGEQHARRGDCRFSVSQNGAEEGRRGYAAGKKIKGRKWHTAVDAQGNLLTMVAYSAE